MPGKAKPRVVWIAGSNLVGLWYSKPMRAEWDVEIGSWWDSSGDYSVSRLGLSDVRDGRLATFASVHRCEVEIWISGWLTAMRQIAAKLPTGERPA